MSIPRRVIVVDDEPLSIRRMEIGLADKPEIALVGVAGDGLRGLALIEAERPDIVFLDIQMPHLSGLEVLAKVAPEDRPAFIFISAHREFGVEAFDLDAADYLLKPFTAERLDEALARALRRCDVRDLAREAARSRAHGAPAAAASPWLSELWVTTKDGERRLRVQEIEWVGAERDYVRIHTAERNYLHRMALKDLLAALDPGAFLQVRRSAFVRVEAVVRAGRDGAGALWVATRDGDPIPVGRSRSRLVRQRLMEAGLRPERG